MITLKEVEHVAKLARLELSEDEKIKFADQLGKLLDYFNQLKEVNTENIEPMAHPVQAVNVVREDIITQSCSREEILKNAPQEEDGYFKVPKIID
ncbi:MAG: Asp-tRNA(Asn)/Glu-tRNA(Gln) amidotransferase subunit GatC [Candidatus Gastranaerophilales bacterium]|nr:Asp-tRNA(Asn)/Glu-tRNA(Gln) amidotransferase subunit GatC [Candidatus Gastranaerophilales bacterium]